MEQEVGVKRGKFPRLFILKHTWPTARPVNWQVDDYKWVGGIDLLAKRGDLVPSLNNTSWFAWQIPGMLTNQSPRRKSLVNGSEQAKER